MVGNKNTDQKNLFPGEGLVMVVDDEPIMRKIAVNVLEGCGYDVIAVNSGAEALKIFNKRHSEIDIVLLDLLMPEMSGKETFYDMKKIKTDVNVLLVTGAKKDSRIQELLDDGIKGLVEKPYTFSYLSQMVHEILNS
jgi:CheY-like chemotaxis protein